MRRSKEEGKVLLVVDLVWGKLSGVELIVRIFRVFFLAILFWHGFFLFRSMSDSTRAFHATTQQSPDPEKLWDDQLCFLVDGGRGFGFFIQASSSFSRVITFLREVLVHFS